MAADDPDSKRVIPDAPADHFLSEEDLDLRNLSWDELIAVWNAWLLQASASDALDARSYSHGVFTIEPDGDE